MFQPLTKEQYTKAIEAGFSPEQIIANEKIRKEKESVQTVKTPPVEKPSFLGTLEKGAKSVGTQLLSNVNPLLGGALQTKTGRNIASGAVKMGVEGLKDAIKPALQPFAMATGKDIPETPVTPAVKAQPTPGEALGEAASAALWELPVEKLVAPVLKPISKLLGGFTERLAGALTGKGGEVISEIVKNPKQALKGLNSDEISVLTNNARQARDTVIQLDTKMKEDYAKALDELPKRLGALPQIMSDNLKTTIKVGGKTYTLSKQGAKAAITGLLRDSGVIVNRAKNFLDFTQSPLNEAEGKTVQKVWNLINDWSDTSPKGLNNLATKIGDFKRTGPGNEYFNGIIGKVKEGIRNYIGDIIPAVKDLNAKYSASASNVEKLRDILDVPNNFKNKENLIDVAKSIQNLFSGNKQLERELLKGMPGGQSIIASEAGRQVAATPSRASASIGDLVRSLAQTVVSPKVIGNLAAYTGLAKEEVKLIIPVLKKLAPAAREQFLNLFINQNQEEPSVLKAGETLKE